MVGVVCDRVAVRDLRGTLGSAHLLLLQARRAAQGDWPQKADLRLSFAIAEGALGRIKKEEEKKKRQELDDKERDARQQAYEERKARKLSMSPGSTPTTVTPRGEEAV